MSAPIPGLASALALAAQADLLLISAEMLRPPQAIQAAEWAPWYESPHEDVSGLMATAFPPVADAPAAALTEALAACLDQIRRHALALDAESWSNEYWRLFGGAQACALNQASYIRRDKGTILGDLCAFYNAWGWRVCPEGGERPDHLLCQLEFTALLLAQAGRAATSGTNEGYDVVLDAVAQFARVHMHDWLPDACQQLSYTTRLEYFAAVAKWLQLLWARLTAAHAWPIDPASGASVLPLAEPDTPYECGAPDLVSLAMPCQPTEKV